MQTIEDCRERLALQMYDALVFISETSGAMNAHEFAATSVVDLHRWWESQGHSLTDELARIRARLDAERAAYAETAP